MIVIICEMRDCVNQGKEVCIASSIKINADGECVSYCSFEELMKQRPKENWRK